MQLDQFADRYRCKNLLADHTQGGKDNSFKQQPLAGVLSQAEISKEGGPRIEMNLPLLVARYLPLLWPVCDSMNCPGLLLFTVRFEVTGRTV